MKYFPIKNSQFPTKTEWFLIDSHGIYCSKAGLERKAKGSPFITQRLIYFAQTKHWTLAVSFYKTK